MKTQTARQRAQAAPLATKSVRCAIYTRKSTHEGLAQPFNSLDAQREAAEAYIASQKHEGWTCIPDRYDDGGYSGGTIDRPALRRLLADVEAGCVDAILVYTYSQKDERRYRYYVCGHARQHGWETCPTKSIPAQEIERFVVDRIRAIGTDPKLTAEVLAKVHSETRARTDALARERAGLERDLVR